MLDQGIDVIGNNLSSAAPFIAAEKRDAKSVGFQLEMSKHAPKGHLTSVMFNWDKHLVPTINAIADGSWTPSEWGAFPGMKDGVVSLSPISDDVPADVKAKIETAVVKIMAGEMTPFDGPIMAQDGSVKVADGASMDDGALWGMDFLVKGVKGTLN